MSEPFLSPDIVRNKLCFLCSKDCKRRESVNYPTVKGWVEFVKRSRRWSEREICIDDPLFHYGGIYERIKDLNDDDDVLDFVKNECCVSHIKCRVNFINRISRYENKYPLKEISNVQSTFERANELHDSNESNTRPRRTFQVKKSCFICNEIRVSDTNAYKEGGYPDANGTPQRKL